MFRIVSTIGFLTTFVGIAVCCVAFPCRRECRWGPGWILRRVVHLFTLLPLEQKASPLGVFRKLVYLLALLCFVILAVTGFYPALILGKPLSGYLLMLHVTAAGVFAACLAALAVMWAHNCRLHKNYWPWLQKILQRQAIDKPPQGVPRTAIEDDELARKICFWIITLSALPLILSAVLSMFPFFGTDIQELLLSTHRYAALLLALVVIVHTYLIIRAQMKE